MGTWGTGNFDNDEALDYVGELADEIAEKIEECFEEDTAGLDEGGEEIVMPSVQILSVLHERCTAATPEPDVVAEWKKRYLAIYDEQIDGLEPAPGYKAERRKVIENTFDTLEKQAREFWKD